MNQNLSDINNFQHNKYSHIEKIIKLVLKTIVPVFILGTGLFLLTMKLPGWGIILGLPMTIIGVVFLIYTYDEVVSSKFKDTEQSDN